MCFDTRWPLGTFLNPEEGEGWKLFGVPALRDFGFLRGWMLSSYRFPLAQWKKFGEDPREHYNNGQGFYFFATRAAAKKVAFGCPIRKIRYRKLVAEGEVMGGRAGMALEIYIIPSWLDRVELWLKNAFDRFFSH